MSFDLQTFELNLFTHEISSLISLICIYENNISYQLVQALLFIHTTNFVSIRHKDNYNLFHYYDDSIR